MDSMNVWLVACGWAQLTFDSDSSNIQSVSRETNTTLDNTKKVSLDLFTWDKFMYIDQTRRCV